MGFFDSEGFAFFAQNDRMFTVIQSRGAVKDPITFVGFAQNDRMFAGGYGL